MLTLIHQKVLRHLTSLLTIATNGWQCSYEY